MESIERWHRQQPTTWGPTQADLVRGLGSDFPAGTLHACIGTLVGRGQLVRAGMHLRRPDHLPSMQARDLGLWRRVEASLRIDALGPTSLSQLQAAVSTRQATLLPLLQRAAGLGLIVELADQRFMLAESVPALVAIARTLAERSDDGAFSVAEFRDATGIGRKFSISVLEHFDRCGITRRLGERRGMVARVADH